MLPVSFYVPSDGCGRLHFLQRADLVFVRKADAIARRSSAPFLMSSDVSRLYLGLSDHSGLSDPRIRLADPPTDLYFADVPGAGSLADSRSRTKTQSFPLAGEKSCVPLFVKVPKSVVDPVCGLNHQP